MKDYSYIFQNPVLIIALLAWTLAQVCKVVLEIFRFGKFDLERFVGSGGMPSSHTALVTSLATATGKMEGWDSTIFAITVVFSMVVMYDAAGVRRAAGKQAEVLNKIIKDVYRGAEIKQESLKELLGHTPFEVLMGALLGVTIALIF